MELVHSPGVAVHEVLSSAYDIIVCYLEPTSAVHPLLLYSYLSTITIET